MAWGVLFWIWGAAALLMALLWARQLSTRNATSVDLAWTLGLGAAAVALSILADGFMGRHHLVGGLAVLWALRLGNHLYHRVRTEEEDGRYAALRAHWGARAPSLFFFFYQGQAFVLTLFCAPLWIAMQRPAAAFDLWDLAGAGMAVLAILGEGIADAQLARWRSDARNRGRTCREGLWRYSRHPNYFFEWLYWWSFVWIGLPGPDGAWTLLGPVLMFLFLFKVTGIPYTEKQALKSRGEDYRRYQRTTSVFFPWFPRRDPAEPES